MPGYGYGETGGRRRGRSSSRSSSPEKRQRGVKKSKKKSSRKRRRDELDEEPPRTGSTATPPQDARSRGGGGEKIPGIDVEKDGARGEHRDRDREKERGRDKDRERESRQYSEKDRLEREGSRAKLGGKEAAVAEGQNPQKEDVAAKRGAWREEMDTADKGADSDTDIAAAVFAPAETDEEVARKLAESRARREALIAKWVNRGEGETGEVFCCPDTNTSMPGAEAASDSDDGEVAQYFEERRKELEGGDDANQTEASLEDKKAVNRFILQFKAEHDGDMFHDAEEGKEDDALNRAVNISAGISQTGASADDWNDKEGYYRAAVSEVMDGRYRVVENCCGKGVFSNVVKAEDKQDKSMVAIKIMRCNDMMRKAAEKEIELLERLNKADRGNKKNVIRLLRTFLYRGHLCLVFECMWDNLRVALKKYTKDKGMSLRAVRAYSKQLLIALRHIHRCGILHADIKPDNILIKADHNLVKICDLGSAMELTEMEPTPYLVSRFYRAPEICFGAKYGPPSDTFAMGATLFELFTGKILFPGKSNNDMLRLFMELKGKFPNKLIKSGMNWKQHFDENLDFKYVDKHPVTRKKIVRTVTDCSAKRNMLDMIMQRIGPEKQKSDNKEDQLYVKKAKQFADFLNQMTTLDPEKRGTPEDLLQHPFVNESMPAPKAQKDVKVQPTA